MKHSDFADFDAIFACFYGLGTDLNDSVASLAQAQSVCLRIPTPTQALRAFHNAPPFLCGVCASGVWRRSSSSHSWTQARPGDFLVFKTRVSNMSPDAESDRLSSPTLILLIPVSHSPGVSIDLSPHKTPILPIHDQTNKT